MTEKKKENLGDSLPDQKVLLVFDNVYKFNDREDRYGSDRNCDEIINIFMDNFDCLILPGKSSNEGNFVLHNIYLFNIKKNYLFISVFTKKYFEGHVQDVRNTFAKSNCDLLIWIVSSHGGTDQFGPFFSDSNGERIYEYPEWIHQMAVERCPIMEKKRIIFFPTYCRNFSLNMSGVGPKNHGVTPIRLSTSEVFFLKSV